jgi:hypothetical protein
MNIGPVAARVVGQFPLSIATSLALEGAVGIHPDHPEQNKDLLVTYQTMWVNLKTLFRNLYQAIDREAILGVRPDELLDGFVQEVNQFESVIATLTSGKMKVVWYVCDYKDLDKAYPHALLRGDTTNLQLAYSAAMKSTLGPWLRVYKDKAKFFLLKIRDYNESRTLMLTHYAIDLLAPNFKSFDLLESHTGAIKSKHLWYTKYYNGKDYPQLPFREDLLQVFGDNETFRPMAPSIRKQIIEIAKQYNWSPVSTSEKVEYGLNQIKDPYLRDVLRSLR